MTATTKSYLLIVEILLVIVLLLGLVAGVDGVLGRVACVARRVVPARLVAVAARVLLVVPPRGLLRARRLARV